jgi:hypothetical protein
VVNVETCPRFWILLTCVVKANILSGLWACLKTSASVPCSSFVAKPGAHLKCSLEHCPIIVCKFLVAVEGEWLINNGIWKGKFNPRTVVMQS